MCVSAIVEKKLRQNVVLKHVTDKCMGYIRSKRKTKTKKYTYKKMARIFIYNTNIIRYGRIDVAHTNAFVHTHINGMLFFSSHAIERTSFKFR